MTVSTTKETRQLQRRAISPTTGPERARPSRETAIDGAFGPGSLCRRKPVIEHLIAGRAIGPSPMPNIIRNITKDATLHAMAGAQANIDQNIIATARVFFGP